jgi:hypothetical protein
MIFYTYMWLREDGTPYYVGKGTGNRAFRGRRHAGNPPPASRILTQEFPEEAAALVFLISFYGRKDNGTGCLANLTDGGENPPNLKGRKKSDFWLSKRIGAPGNTAGKTFSEETKKKMRESQQKRRSVPVTEEFRRTMSKAFALKPRKGYKLSDATRARMTAGQKARRMREQNG